MSLPPASAPLADSDDVHHPDRGRLGVDLAAVDVFAGGSRAAAVSDHAGLPMTWNAWKLSTLVVSLALWALIFYLLGVL